MNTKKLIEKVKEAYWPPGAGHNVNQRANRKKGDAYVETLRISEMIAILNDYSPGAKCEKCGHIAHTGGREGLFCILQEKLKSIGWIVK